MKKCKVIINKNKETIEANFYGVFQKAWTHGDSLLVGGYKAGQIAYPVVVVDWGEGLKEVNVADVVEVSELQQELENEAGNKEQLQTEVAQLKQDIEQIKTDHSIELTNKNSEITEKQREIEAKHQEINDKQNRINELNNEPGAVNGQLSQIEAQVDGLLNHTNDKVSEIAGDN